MLKLLREKALQAKRVLRPFSLTLGILLTGEREYMSRIKLRQ